MLNQALFKRIIPFIAALLAGLFITAIFIDITPNFNKYKSNKKRHFEKHRMKQLKYENWQLKRDKQRLTEELEFKNHILLDVAPPPPAPVKVMVVPSESVPSTRK